MKGKEKKFDDAIFLIIEERSCPLYGVGEEIKIENASFSISSYKPSCLHLAGKISNIVQQHESLTGFSPLGGMNSNLGTQKSRYSCGGCHGMIHFEFKQEKDYATLQMKLLKDSEEQRKRKHLQKFFGQLRRLKIFDSLEDDSLKDLTLLLDLKTILPDKVVVKKGEPSIHLYIVLKGVVAIIDDDGSKLMEMREGEIFGETSLLSGEPANNSILTLEATQVALLSVKNFKSVLKKYPVLQIFLFKLLVEKAQANTLRSGNITSGMVGELDEIAAVDLFQLINSSQKTGIVELLLKEGRALVCFSEGEIIHARFLKLRDKDAVFALLGARNGRFNYRRGIPPELTKLPPVGGFMGMMMEGLQRIDEG